MGEATITSRTIDWLAYLPIRLAYRLIWAMALTGNGTAKAVYKAMWSSYLDIPRIAKLTKDWEN